MTRVTKVATVLSIIFGCNTAFSASSIANFHIIQLDSNLVIKWQSNYELNEDYFEIERSTDSINFTTIITRQAQGNSLTVSSYADVDSTAVLGQKYYYRLKAVDIQGDFEYSVITCFSGSIILPSNIINLGAWRLNSQTATMYIFWNSSGELNTSHFDIERSIDGLSYDSVLTVQARGQLSRGTYYDTTDITSVSMQSYYYRIKSVSFDNTLTYSDSIFVEESGGGGALPVEITFFNVNRENDHALLNWETTIEVDVDKYHVERSIDGLAFNVIKTVDAVGQLYLSEYYSFLDTTIVPDQQYYYRLSSIDSDSNFVYSNIVPLIVLGLETESQTSILRGYPNPTSGELIVDLDAYHQKLYVEVHNELGQLIESTVYSETNQVRTNINGPSGNYFVTIYYDDKYKKVLKVIKN